MAFNLRLALCLKQTALGRHNAWSSCHVRSPTGCLVTRHNLSVCPQSCPSARPGQACIILYPVCFALLQHAKTRREAIGVELYNFQQQLAKMQMQLEKAQENYAHISQIRRQAEEQLQRLQTTHAEEEQLTSQERLKVVFTSCPPQKCSIVCACLQPLHTSLCPSGVRTAQHVKGIKSCTLLLHWAVSNATRT